MSVKLVELAFRYIIDTDEQRKLVVLDCVEQMVRRGHDPTACQPTPMSLVAEHFGAKHDRTRDFFKRLAIFFEDCRMVETAVKLTALIAGYDIRGISTWGDIMDLHDSVVEQDIDADAWYSREDDNVVRYPSIISMVLTADTERQLFKDDELDHQMSAILPSRRHCCPRPAKSYAEMVRRGTSTMVS